MALGPELLRRVGVSWMSPDLRRLAALDMDDLDKVVLILFARPLGADGRERDGVSIVGQDVVQLQTGRAPGQLGDLAQQPEHLSHAFVVAGQGTPAGNVPADALGEELILQRVEVSWPEGRDGRPRPGHVRVWPLILPPV